MKPVVAGNHHIRAAARHTDGIGKQIRLDIVKFLDHHLIDLTVFDDRNIHLHRVVRHRIDGIMLPYRLTGIGAEFRTPRIACAIEG